MGQLPAGQPTGENSGKWVGENFGLEKIGRDLRGFLESGARQEARGEGNEA
jgi:hypothetical protein